MSPVCQVDVGSVADFDHASRRSAYTLALLLKPVTEGLSSTTSYGFDAKEFGSNAPILKITVQTAATSVSNVQFFYRYSADNATWTSWTAVGNGASAPYTSAFSYPNGYGYYEFYSVATDNLGNSESTPAHAETSVHYQPPTGQTQTINFVSVGPTQMGTQVSLSATAGSGLAVTFRSQTAAVCSVSGNVVTLIAAGVCTLAADQVGDAGYWLSASATQSFTVNAAAADTGGTGDAPLPPWALALLASLLLATQSYLGRSRGASRNRFI